MLSKGGRPLWLSCVTNFASLPHNILVRGVPDEALGLYSHTAGPVWRTIGLSSVLLGLEEDEDGELEDTKQSMHHHKYVNTSS